ncbi:hypothetical protein ANN_04263 [Periplaneta americana]|uniref:Uncharacterized protein n=1 Tax=Periplaneta americana TaxID=6978 RepID=A0ABQ8T833_PERAM|nr:hypothetical protein ANN_04263 [Periplaneta americana]
MAGLCEGGNEPPGSLKAITATSEEIVEQILYMVLHNRRLKVNHRYGVMVSTLDHETRGPELKSWLGQVTSLRFFPGFSLNPLRADAGMSPKVVVLLLVCKFGTSDANPSVADIRMFHQLRDELKDEQEVVETYTSPVFDEIPDLDMEDGKQGYGDIEDEPIAERLKDGQKAEDAEETSSNQHVFLHSLFYKNQKRSRR